MRIIGGEFGGRRFNPPAKNWPTRPTTDQSKEGLFNILNNRIYFEDTKMLDLFGGTGNHCYEFISRGCTDATYVDKFRGAVTYVTKMRAELKVEDKLKVVKSDVFKFMRSATAKYDYIFAGPPYPLPNLDDIPNLLFKADILAEGGLFVLEHNPNHDFKEHERYVEERNYGSTIFSFFE